jgi:hypothetical protein
MTAIQLFKYAIDTHLPYSIPRRSFVDYVAQHLIELSHAHATHRVMIYEEQGVASSLKALVSDAYDIHEIWVFNPRVYLFGQGSPSVPPEWKTKFDQAFSNLSKDALLPGEC